jgi:hypothetical protein
MGVGFDSTGIDISCQTMTTTEDVMVDMALLKLDKGIGVGVCSVGDVSGFIAAAIDIVKFERTGIIAFGGINDDGDTAFDVAVGITSAEDSANSSTLDD